MSLVYNHIASTRPTIAGERGCFGRAPRASLLEVRQTARQDLADIVVDGVCE